MTPLRIFLDYLQQKVLLEISPTPRRRFMANNTLTDSHTAKSLGTLST